MTRTRLGTRTVNRELAGVVIKALGTAGTGLKNVIEDSITTSTAIKGG